MQMEESKKGHRALTMASQTGRTCSRPATQALHSSSLEGRKAKFEPVKGEPRKVGEKPQATPGEGALFHFRGAARKKTCSCPKWTSKSEKIGEQASGGNKVRMHNSHDLCVSLPGIMNQQEGKRGRHKSFASRKAPLHGLGENRGGGMPTRVRWWHRSSGGEKGKKVPLGTPFVEDHLGKRYEERRLNPGRLKGGNAEKTHQECKKTSSATNARIAQPI